MNLKTLSNLTAYDKVKMHHISNLIVRLLSLLSPGKMKQLTSPLLLFVPIFKFAEKLANLDIIMRSA